MHFLGLLPMIDPPRFDTAVTVRRLMDAGVEVTLGGALGGVLSLEIDLEARTWALELT